MIQSHNLRSDQTYLSPKYALSFLLESYDILLLAIDLIERICYRKFSGLAGRFISQSAKIIILQGLRVAQAAVTKRWP